MLKLIKTSKIVVTIEPDKKEAFIKTALHFRLEKLAEFVRQDESHEISMSDYEDFITDDDDLPTYEESTQNGSNFIVDHIGMIFKIES